MSQPTLESFFSGGGGKSVSWKDKPIGTTVTGTILAVHPPQQVTDPADGKPKFNRNGQPIMQVRVDLQTDFRNWELCKPPDDPSQVDDGARALYVGGWMQGAVGDALRKAGRQGPPEVGGWISVTLTERTPNENPALQPINKFVAQYQSPAAQATGQFFQPPQNGYAGAPQQQPVPAQSAAAPQYVQQATAAPQAPPMPPYVAPQPPAAPPAAPAPPRPDTIAEAAWNAMDDATKVQVAATMANLPPF